LIDLLYFRDNGYFSGPNLRYLEKNSWMAIFQTASRLRSRRARRLRMVSQSMEH